MAPKVMRVAIAAVVGISACLAAAEPGLISLFDGKTLDGWIPEHSNRFCVREGAIANDGGTGWLRSARSYKDFEVQLEYRTTRKGAEGGLLFRTSAESTPNEPFRPLRGYQLQITDTDTNLKIFGHGTPPPTFDRRTDALKAAMKGPGEWQALTVKVVGKHVEATLNGAVITASDGIAITEGYLGLQAENGPFEWRNLRIRELTPP